MLQHLHKQRFPTLRGFQIALVKAESECCSSELSDLIGQCTLFFTAENLKTVYLFPHGLDGFGEAIQVLFHSVNQIPEMFFFLIGNCFTEMINFPA